VISANEENVIGIGEKKSEKENYNFNGIFTTVNVISKKKKTRTRRSTSVNENPKKIKNVAVNITNNVKRSMEIHNNVGPLKNFTGAFADLTDDVLIKGGDCNGTTDFFTIHTIEFKKGTEALKNKTGGTTGTAHNEEIKYGEKVEIKSGKREHHMSGLSSSGTERT
jgi:hypothetical protein